MTNIEPSSVSVGTLFRYPQVIGEQQVLDWLDSRGFDATSPRGAQIAPGVQVGNDDPLMIARNDNLVVLFNQAANLEGNMNGSFVTVKDESGEDLDSILDAVGAIHQQLEQNGLHKDVNLVESISEGRIRVERDRSFSSYFDQDKLETIEGSTGVPATGVAARFEADQASDKAGWYRILLDSGTIRNPRVWAYKLVRRYDHHSDINKDDTNDIINTIVENS